MTTGLPEDNSFLKAKEKFVTMEGSFDTIRTLATSNKALMKMFSLVEFCNFVRPNTRGKDLTPEKLLEEL